MRAYTGFAFVEPIWLDEVDSTNDYVKARAKEHPLPPSGTVVAAREQLSGRGRHGNIWHSRKKGDITFSFLWRGCVGLGEVGTLPMACALAVTDYILHIMPESRPRCKWPNDVLVDDAKICGILTEGATAGEGMLSLIIGIGLNVVKDPCRDARIGERATSSIESLSGKRHSQDEVLSGMLRHIEDRINDWQSGGFAAIRDGVQERLWGVGRQVATRVASGKVRGVLCGLGANGEALLRGPDGIVPVSSVTALDYIH